MPIVQSNSNFPNQVGPDGSQPFSTQSNFREMIGEVTMWNPDADPLMVGRWINNHYRKVIERRNWYGLMTRGILSTAQMTTIGQAQTTFGTATVQGVGTAWDESLIGQQFRAGMTNPFQTIVEVDATAQVLTLDMPYPGLTRPASAYQIADCWASFGGNVRSILEAVNQQQGYRIETNVPQQTINALDTWRTSFGWSRVFSAREATPDGQLQVEIWPIPYSAQTFPFLAYTQPPSLVNDSDTPAVFLRSDVLVLMAIADALVFRGKQNRYYDPQIAQAKHAEAEAELQKMERNDDAKYPQDSTWDYGAEFDGVGEGALWGQSHLSCR